MDLSFPWGTYKSFDLAVTDEDDEVVPLAGKVIKMIAKKKIADADTSAVFKLEIGSGITVPSGGGDHTALVEISPESTKSLARSTPTTLHYMCFLETGGKRYELQSGKITVTPSVAE